MTREAAIYRYRNQSAQDLTDTQQLELNYSLALNANPWLAQAPETLAQLATSGIDPESLVTQAGAMAGMQNLDEMQQALERLTPSGQRALYGKLTEQQQRGLAGMGFNPPGDPGDPGFIGGILGGIGEVAAPVFGVVSAPVRAVANIGIPGTDTNLFSGALNVMSWIGDVPGHMYRTIRQMEGWQQWVALGVGVAVAAALPFAAPAALAAIAGAAGGGTLATIGTVAGAGLAAGFATTALTSTMVTSPTEWWDIANPFGTRGVMRGERIFSADAKQKAARVLGNVPHLDAMARDIAANLDVYDLAEEFAGERDATNVNVMTAAIEKVATSMTDPGTPEYEALYQGLTVLVEQPEFREAIDTLQSGKISFGRDVAGALGMERGDFGHGIVSGTADALMLLSVDPFLLIGHAGKVARIGRHGIPIPDGDDALNRLTEMIARDDRLGATVDQVMGAVVAQDFRSMPKAWRPLFDDMSDWQRGKVQAGEAFETREDFAKWIVEGTKMKKLLEGKATIAGQERLIFNTTNRSVGMGRLAETMRRVSAGLDDASLEKLMRSNAKKIGVEDELETILPSLWNDLPVESTWTSIVDDTADQIRESLSYKTGNVVGKALVRVPGGTSALALLGNIQTMIPPGKAIALFGEGAEEDILRFVQTMGRHFNMPSYARDEWLNTIMRQGTVGQRRAAVNSFMDSTLTAAGFRTDDVLSRQVDALLSKQKHAYELGGYDQMPARVLDHMSVTDAAGLAEFTKTINRTVGNLPVQHQAVHMVVPSLREMSAMIYNGRVLKHVAKVVDSNFASQAMSRFIKPGWLLRIGFIPRAAGEEALAWMMRVSEGGIMQEFAARSLGSRVAYRDARAALLSVGRKKMTPEQLKALDFQVASHLRPLANMMRRNGNLLPDDHLLVRWSETLRDALESGLDVGWTRNLTELTDLRKARLEDLTRSQRVRLAQLNMRDAILLGKPQSVRRMILNGVDPDLTEAAALWVMRHSDAVMKSTSSMNASLFERDIVNPDKEIQFIPNARELGQDDSRLVMMTGERTRIRPNDLYFDNATHHRIQQFFSDDIVGRIIREEYLKYMPDEGMGYLGRANLLEALQVSRNVKTNTSQRLVFELFNPREDNIAGAIENMYEIAADTGNEVVEMAAIAADRANTRGVFNLDELLVELQRVDDEWARKPEYLVDESAGVLGLADEKPIPHTRNIQRELEAIRPIIEGLDALGPNERRFVTAAMTTDMANSNGYFDLNGLERLVTGDTAVYSEPRMKLFRGIKDRSTIELIPGPEGPTLRIKASPHSEWGNNPNISTSIEWEHAMSYAVHPQAFTGASNRGYGALIEMDGEFVFDQMGRTWDDVVSNPILYSNADPSRGRGAYLIGAGSVDETEVALFMGEGSRGLPLSDQEREAFDLIDDLFSDVDQERLANLRELDMEISMALDAAEATGVDASIQSLRQQQLDVMDEIESLTLSITQGPKSDAVREALSRLDDDSAVVQDVQQFFDAASAWARGGGSPLQFEVITETILAERAARLQPDVVDYIDIPFGKYKIHDSASMAKYQEKSLTSSSRFADRIHNAQFETVWGQPLDEYWTSTIGELDSIIDSLDDAGKAALAAALGDFTFASIKSMDGAQIAAYMRAGDHPVDQRLVDFFTRETGEADFPTEWDGLVAEITAANEDPRSFFSDLDEYILARVQGRETKTRAKAAPNRWKGLKESFELRGTGEIAPEQLELLGQGWTGFYNSVDDLKAGIQYRLSQELMRPENQQYTKLSDQVLQLNDGTHVVKPIDGGLARLYTPVVPQNLNPSIDPMIHSEFMAWFNDNMSALASTYALTLLQRQAAREPGQTIAYLNALLGEYEKVQLPVPPSMRMFINNWGSNDPRVSAELLEQYWDDFDRVLDDMMAPYVANAATRLVIGQDLRRVNDPMIQAMTADERTDLISEALAAMIKNRSSQQPVAQALSGLAFDDPRIARYITNTLSDAPFDDSIKHMQIGQVDVPRQSVIGRATGDRRRIEGVRPRKEAHDGQQYRVYTLDGQYGPKTEISDGSHLVETPDGLRPGASWEKAVDEWAGRIVESMWNAHTRGFRETSKVKPAAQLNGRRVGRRSGDRIVPVEDGEEFTLAPDLYVIDENGKVEGALEGMSSEFFDRVPVEGNDELMWTIIGPMISDLAEQDAGFTRIVSRKLATDKKPLFRKAKATMPIDTPLETEQWGVLTRSRVDDIDLEPATALPNIQIAAQYKQLPNNMWDRFVRWGFDSVIGPSVDAIVRKPMSFHYFAGAYKQNKAYLSWMLDDKLFKQDIPRLFKIEIDTLTKDTELSVEQLEAVRDLAKYVYDEDLDISNIDNVRRFLVGLGADDWEMAQAIMKGRATMRAIAHSAAGDAMRAKYPDWDNQDSALTFAEWDEIFEAHPANQHLETLAWMQNSVKRSGLHWQLPEHGFNSDSVAERLVAAYHHEIPEEMWTQPNDAIAGFLELNTTLPHKLTEEQWGVLRAAQRNLSNTLHDLNETATLRAVNNIAPFLDSHEQRTMFAEYGRNFIPFWYAEENFLKRWGRTIAMDGLTGGLATIRKAQLMYAGLRSGGVIRTDVNGKDWFVYPGSGVLQEVIDKIWIGKSALPIGVLMQASTDSLLPGINDQFGQASFSPLIAVPLNSTLQLFPETQDLRRSIMGDIAINRSIVKQFVPGIASNLWDVAFADETSSTKYSSAMMTAIAFAEANDQGLPDGATAVQADEYLDRIRNHTRIILLTQAITGYFVPGAPSAIATNEEEMGSFSWLTGIGVDDPRQITTDLYRSYISNLGVEEGTAAFLRAFPNADLEDVVNPMAFTTSASTSVSGAPLPATAVGLSWYNDNKAWVDGMPEAGAWFLPPDEDDAEFDYYSYSQQLANGLRKQKSPLEFLRSIKYRQGAEVYFANRDVYDAGIARVGDNAAAKREIDARWAIWADEFKAAHPIFAEELMSGASRERRARTVQQLRDAVNDPFLPPSPHVAGIKEMVDAYDMFTAARAKYSIRRDEDSRRKLAALKARFADWVTSWQLRNPQLERLWSSVYEPEARLD